MRRFASQLLRLLSGEFILNWLPNGGGVVLARALISTVLLYLGAVGLRDYLAPHASLAFDATKLAAGVRDTLPWAGAIFAAIYAAFYARFASQWSYLAGLYNQIMACQVQTPWESHPKSRQAYASWMAGFIEDAEDLHLAARPMYAAVIDSMLSRPEVRDTYLADTVDGPRRLRELNERLTAVLGRPVLNEPHVLEGRR